MAKRFLTLNIGAATVALAEYELGGKGALTLVNYGTAKLGASLDTGDAQTILTPAILEVVREKGIKPGKVAVAVSGQMVFPKFAAIPMAGGEERFEQMVRYEVEQNIPFPIDEMVCDRQIIGDTVNGDKSVMIVAAKVDQIEAITSAVVAAGFEPEIVDASPIALTNAVRYNRPEEEEMCVIALDIGAKTTSLVIAEGDKLYNRSIPVAGNSITKEIAQALGCTSDEAENVKIESGYVSLGGVTEDEDEVADRVSKVCRAVLTRLHAEITRSINFYRSQQGGGTPVKMYLTGGNALLPQIDRFFADSLQIEVELFQPFERIAVSPKIDAEQLGFDAVFLASTAGLALHMSEQARFAVNLLPPSIVDARAEKARIPVLAAGAALVVASLVVALLSVGHSTSVVERQLESVRARSEALKNFDTRVKKAVEAYDATQAEADRLGKLLISRVSATMAMNAVRSSLLPGMWIEKWDNGKVTIRGWKDRIRKSMANVKGKTAGELVAEKLRGKIAVDSESVKISDMSAVGKDGLVEQFTVEMKFK
jgi:type IV pilus assembly protein PilM